MTAHPRHPGLASLRSALTRLGDALDQPKTEWTRDASIQRFEFCFELAWKAVARFAREEAVEAPSPRQALRAALKLGWIEDDSAWLTMLNDRNLTSHTYHEATAEELYGRLRQHHERLTGLLSRLQGLDRADSADRP